MKAILIAVLVGTLTAHCDDHLADALAQTGALLSASGKLDQAEEALYLALAHDDRCPAAYLELGKIAEKRGDKSFACSLYAKAEERFSDQSKRSECAQRIKNISLLPLRLKQAMVEYSTALDKLESLDGPLLHLKLDERRMELGLTKKAIVQPPMPKTAFTPIGKWIKNEDDNCVLKFTDDKRITMQGVAAKWSVKDSVVIVEWSKFWGVSKFSVTSDDTMTESNGNRLVRVKE